MGEQRRRQALQGAPEPAQADDTGRKLWVVAVLAFWISTGITLTVLLITGKLNLILVSVTLGMMLLGVWLKVRYQLRRRRQRGRASDGGAA
jgi:Flp pilus assembly protein TadB